MTHPDLTVHLFPCLNDNYGFLVRCETTGKVAVIDTPDAATIIHQVENLGWNRIDYIFNTHWHPDHAGGNQAVQAKYGCHIRGPQEVAKRYPLNEILSPGERTYLGETPFDIIDLKGHTLGQIGYVNPELEIAFIGDCLFPLGCGRVFEGTMAEMWDSLKRLSELPCGMQLYCAHEYALSNLAFAESLGHDHILAERAGRLRAARAQNLPTVPTRLGDEIASNPFLRFPLEATDPAVQVHQFTQLRQAKDDFRP